MAVTINPELVMKSEAEAVRAVEKYADTIRRVCFLHLKNYSDMEDEFQNVFLKYLLHTQSFESDAHEKAWLIRVAINACKDTLKSFFRRRVTSLDNLNQELFHIQDENKYILDAILKLPHKYKDVIYMHYYEGYTAVEIAEILSRNENTVYTWLARARNQLKEDLGSDFFDK